VHPTPLVLQHLLTIQVCAIISSLAVSPVPPTVGLLSREVRVVALSAPRSLALQSRLRGWLRRRWLRQFIELRRRAQVAHALSLSPSPSPSLPHLYLAFSLSSSLSCMLSCMLSALISLSLAPVFAFRRAILTAAFGRRAT
jgi:hypothetical protein